MNLAEIRLPRQLEADGTAEAVRRALAVRTVKLWPGGVLDVPVIALGEPQVRALRLARLNRRVQYGFEAVSERLAGERKGIESVRERADAAYGDRVSRLLLFSNDGAVRFYRHVESLLQAHAPRMLGCLLDLDGPALGRALSGRESLVKLVLVEHKDAVSELLRTIAAVPDARPSAEGAAQQRNAAAPATGGDGEAGRPRRRIVRPSASGKTGGAKK